MGTVSVTMDEVHEQTFKYITINYSAACENVVKVNFLLYRTFTYTFRKDFVNSRVSKFSLFC